MKRHMKLSINSYIMRICLYYNQGENLFTLPNLISLARICLLIPFVICLMQVQHEGFYRYVALGIILTTGVSDILDGYLARKRGEVTKFGLFIDPIADKLILVAACLLLSSDKLWPEPRLPNWAAAIIISREIIHSLGLIGALIFLKRKIVLCANKLGKFTTFMQVTVIMAVLLGNHFPLSTLITLCCFVSAVTLISAVNYLYRGIEVLRN